MKGWMSDTPYFDSRGEHDLEERVTSWIARQGSSSWILTTFILGSTFLAMVLFAASR
jgi:hypothetical protein